MKTIFKREVLSFVKSPVAYVICALFLLVSGLFSWIYNFLGGSVFFGDTLNRMSLFLVVFIPLITMKLLADEKKNGTEVLLRTSPVTMTEVVVGKFLSAYFIYFCMVILTVIYPIIMSLFASIPFVETFTAYLGFLLMGAFFVAIGIFASSVTENQIIAAAIGIVTLLIMYFMSSIGATIGGVFGVILMWVSPLSRFSDFTMGSINFAYVFFYISFTAVILFITSLNMERRRWN